MLFKEQIRKKRKCLVVMATLFLFSLPLSNLSAQIFIQAEDYSDMQGIETQITSDDGGGINVGWIDNNDWMEYEVNIPLAGDYIMNLRTASLNGGGVLSILVDQNTLANVNIRATGGWQDWESVESSAFGLQEGNQTIRLLATSGGFNLNWFELKLVDPLDTDMPSSPLLVDSIADIHTISLSWTACDDTTTMVTGYKIFNDNVFLAFSSDTTFSLSKLPPETVFNLSIYACDLAGNQSAPAQITIATLEVYWDLVWYDEFEGTEVDLTKWNFETGGHGWGNGEAQYYTNGDNASVEDGCLIIEARQETIGNNNYTSSRMNNANKGSFLYGRIEVRAKLPSTGGTWPAIWTLPTEWSYGDWPDCGEIDIMEHTGNNLGYVFGTIHTGAYNHQAGTQKGAGVWMPDVVNTFHTYALEWYPDRLDWYYDDQIIFTFENEYNTYAEWPFDIEHHIMLNIAVGGGLGGTINHNGTWPQHMYIDYVRIYDFDLGAGDTIPPTTPTNLQAEVSGVSVDLSWTISTDNNYIEKYYILKNNEVVDSTSGSRINLIRLEPLTQYTFGIQAKDFGGNFSEIATVIATTEDIESFSIPGKFEAEDYLYMEGMESEICTDIGGGYNMGYIDEGDWLEYSIEVESEGKYFLSTRAASQSSTGKFELLDQDQNVLTTVTTPVTGGWQVWTTIVSEGFMLTEGVQNITIKSLAEEYNLNWFAITADSTEYPASIHSVLSRHHNIYPNPLVGNTFTIELEKSASNVEICIYSIEGQKILNRRFENMLDHIIVDDLDLKTGFYLITIKLDNTIFTHKLLVN